MLHYKVLLIKIVVTSTSYVAKQSNNSANPNSSVSYLNVNNTTFNTNANISSKLLTVDYNNIEVTN